MGDVTGKVRILVVMGSTREGRFAEKPAHWIHDLLAQDQRLDVELVDLRAWPLPFFDMKVSPFRVSHGDYPHEIVKRWSKLVSEADGFVMTAAEYNHGYTAVLKNALDWLGHEWKRKPVAFVGYGSAGGARAVEQLRQVVIELQMAPLKHAVHISGPVFMAVRNEPTAPVKPELFAPVEPAALALRDDLVWWTRALRDARSSS